MNDEKFTAELHIPTEQFGFILIHLTDEPGAILEAYKRFQGMIKGGDGVEEKEMNIVVDKMLKGETINGGMEIYVRMNEKQQFAIQTIKRGTARVNYKLKKEHGIQD